MDPDANDTKKENPVELAPKLDLETQPMSASQHVQPFEKCRQRDEWNRKFGHLITLDIEAEKQTIAERMKPPRKPLSPYIFFSQENRKEIKRQPGN